MTAKACELCGGQFEAARSTARFCSDRCRQRSRRAPAARAAVSTDEESPFEKATRGELAKLNAVESMLGQQVLTIARRMGRGAETGASITTLSKEHSRLMGLIASSGGKSRDPVDEMRERREQKAREAAAAVPAG